MNQTELNRAVARATGETVDRIQRMGFRLLVMPSAYACRERKQPLLKASRKTRERRQVAAAV